MRNIESDFHLHIRTLSVCIAMLLLFNHMLEYNAMVRQNRGIIFLNMEFFVPILQKSLHLRRGQTQG